MTPAEQATLARIHAAGFKLRHVIEGKQHTLTAENAETGESVHATADTLEGAAIEYCERLGFDLDG